MTEKSNISPMEAVFWYNISPKAGQKKSVPQRAVFKNGWWYPMTTANEEQVPVTNRSYSAVSISMFTLQILYF